MLDTRNSIQQETAARHHVFDDTISTIGMTFFMRIEA